MTSSHLGTSNENCETTDDLNLDDFVIDPVVKRRPMGWRTFGTYGKNLEQNGPPNLSMGVV